MGGGGKICLFFVDLLEEHVKPRPYHEWRNLNHNNHQNVFRPH